MRKSKSLSNSSLTNTGSQPVSQNSRRSSSGGDSRCSTESSTIEGEPHEDDVLFGRGKRFYNHPGTRRLIELAKEHQAAYREAGRGEKQNIVDKIIGIIKEESGTQMARFLKRDGEKWVEVTHEEKRKKVGHTIRDRLPPKSPSEPTTKADGDSIVESSNDERDHENTSDGQEEGEGPHPLKLEDAQDWGELAMLCNNLLNSSSIMQLTHTGGEIEPPASEKPIADDDRHLADMSSEE